ncbi:hypothetical protein [Chryseobacterium sp. OSA05B]|uniref:hypothetical protein n=1 Tax=Chryseobacterium sp. OSA05B TaxID=2862650 RepID=UPI001CBC7F16|nr:hypothetical protein [Chryseobacterium sp. OSA05B]
MMSHQLAVVEREVKKLPLVSSTSILSTVCCGKYPDFELVNKSISFKLASSQETSESNVVQHMVNF